MRNVYNFSAGPAVLPEPILQEAADEMLDYKGSGMSVMGISHRSSLFQSITKSDAIDAEFIKQAEKHGIISIKGHRAIGGMRKSSLSKFITVSSAVCRMGRGKKQFLNKNPNLQNNSAVNITLFGVYRIKDSQIFIRQNARNMLYSYLLNNNNSKERRRAIVKK